MDSSLTRSRDSRGAQLPGASTLWSAETEQLIEAALREDVGSGDVTTRRVVPPELRGRARVVARDGGVLAGADVAASVFHRLDATLAVSLPLAEGALLAPGAVLLELTGRVAPILTGERVALNFLQRLCGVASLTRRFVEAVAGTGACIVDTRKTTPGWRELERAAVRAGGGVNHRAGLFEAVLLKENHVRAAGGVAAAWRTAQQPSGEGASRDPRRGDVESPAFLEIEVRDRRELEEALAAGARMILLDNFPPDELREAVREARRRCPEAVLEASGGITLATARAAAEAGVDRISVGALTHSAPALDMTLLLTEVA